MTKQQCIDLCSKEPIATACEHGSAEGYCLLYTSKKVEKGSGHEHVTCWKLGTYSTGTTIIPAAETTARPNATGIISICLSYGIVIDIKYQIWRKLNLVKKIYPPYILASMLVKKSCKHRIKLTKCRLGDENSVLRKFLCDKFVTDDVLTNFVNW